MSSRLIPISGCGTKAPACFLVNTAHARIMLDLGAGAQRGTSPDVSAIGAVDALLLSHSHADHAGALELRSAIGNPGVHASAIVGDLLGPGIDTTPLPLCGSIDVCGIRVTTGRSGHAPGSVWLHLDVDDGLLYTGDYCVESPVYAYDVPPPARTVILDASYGDDDASLTDRIDALERVFDAGPVLLPVPAAGRAADIALHVARSGRGLPHIDDEIRAVLVKLATGYRECVRPGVAAELATIARDAPGIERAEGIMLASAADAASGRAAELVSSWEKADAPAIVFTGYVPPRTPAERLTRTTRASVLRWNVHPRLSDNAALVRACGAKVVIPAFADAKYIWTWRSAFAGAQIAFEGPVIL
jgi:Cft2 family RNA processing exonuclease